MLLIISFMLVGCGNSKSADDFVSLYSSLERDTDTSTFFQNSNLKINLDTSKVMVNEGDKSYIFTCAYNSYLASSSRLFSGAVGNILNVSVLKKEFKDDELNDLYTKLSTVQSNLKTLYNSKKIYEDTSGNLHYKNLIADCNNLINSLYVFNDAFADYYFKGMGKVDPLNGNLSNTNLKNILAFELMKLSKVSFNYELINFKFSNPLSEVYSWYEKTQILKNFTTLSNNCVSVLDRLDSGEDLVAKLTTTNNLNAVINLIQNFQSEQKKFDNDYTLFMSALNNFNVTAYNSSTNKKAYLENCSYKEKSSFNLINNFINGNYKALSKNLTDLISLM